MRDFALIINPHVAFWSTVFKYFTRNSLRRSAFIRFKWYSYYPLSLLVYRKTTLRVQVWILITNLWLPFHCIRFTNTINWNFTPGMCLKQTECRICSSTAFIWLVLEWSSVSTPFSLLIGFEVWFVYMHTLSGGVYYKTKLVIVCIIIIQEI